MVDEESLRKVGATAKLVVGGRTRARVGGKDNMWVVNILMSGGRQEMVMRKMEKDRRARDEKKELKYGWWTTGDGQRQNEGCEHFDGRQEDQGVDENEE